MTASAKAADPAPPAFRLPETVAPVKVSASLSFGPAEDAFSGTVDIDLDVKAPVRVIWLHAVDLVVSGERPVSAGPGPRPVAGAVQGPERVRADGRRRDRRGAPRRFRGAGSPGQSSRGVLWDFMKERWAPLLERLPATLRPEVFAIPGFFCDEAHRSDVETFLKDKAPTITGAPRMLAQSLESISLCMAKRDANRESLRAFLKKQ